MKASNSMMLAAATATSAQTLLNNTGDVAVSSSVSYLVAAYEQLSTSTAAALAEPSADAALSLNDTAAATTPTEAALDTAALLPTTPTDALVADTGVASAPTEAAIAAETDNAATAADSAAAEATQAEGLPPVDLASTTSVTTEFNTQAAGYTQESLALLPTVESATRTYTVPAGLPTSYPSPFPLTTGTKYELSPDVDLLPTASLPSYVTTVTYTKGSSMFLSTVTSDCGNGTMVFPPSTQPPVLPPAPTTGPGLPPAPAPPASYPPFGAPSSTYPLAPPPSEPTLSSSASIWTDLPPSTLTEIPLTTLTIITGTLTSYSTVVSNCGNGSMTHAPSAPMLPPTSINIGPVMPSLPGGESGQPPAPTEAPGLFPGLPTPIQPLPETPCSEATGEAPYPIPAATTTPAYTNVWSASEVQLSPANPTQGHQFLSVLNTTMATIHKPTPSPTIEDPELMGPPTTIAGGWSQGSGTADPGLFAGGATSAHEPSKIWVVLGAFLAVAWMF
ncbi:hypothetical protein CBER1_00700 [Cercospora berteroae]|uniref:Uncharacterized protein n=1 Tax=Cercospora berteroae TaxID=357750 RepID=A0A2S6C9J0_9PEZI|nr:hypothetical protein CBER1_00700 [Cercospora berteroae]